MEGLDPGPMCACPMRGTIPAMKSRPTLTKVVLVAEARSGSKRVETTPVRRYRLARVVGPRS